VRTVQLMGGSGLVNGNLLAAAAGDFEVLITGDRNMQYQQSASQLPMSVVVLIALNNKLVSFLPLVGRLLSTLATLQELRNIELEAEE
jgi:putative NIF3 family GTP cyclohydrolase 1 type 2